MMNLLFEYIQTAEVKFSDTSAYKVCVHCINRKLTSEDFLNQLCRARKTMARCLRMTPCWRYFQSQQTPPQVQCRNSLRGLRCRSRHTRRSRSRRCSRRPSNNRRSSAECRCTLKYLVFYNTVTYIKFINNDCLFEP